MAFWVTHGGLCKSARPGSRTRHNWIIEPLESRVLLATTPLLSPVLTSLAGNAPVLATAVGDVNGDGIPDVVVVRAPQPGQTLSTAQVYFGSAVATFAPGPTVKITGQLAALASFTGTGRLDLATAAGVLPGTPNGGFGRLIPGLVLPPNTVRLFAGDFNGDGKMDLAAATFTAASGTNRRSTVGLSVMLGNGNGTFGPPISTPVFSGVGITANDAVFTTGDFNGDGKLDVVSPFGVLPGNGIGTFTSPLQPLPMESLPASPVFAVGDFNGDGELDLAMVPPGEAAGEVDIFLGNGNGTFHDSGPVVVSTDGGSVSALAAADLNGDGKPDLIVGIDSKGANPAISILINNGSGTFPLPLAYPADGVPLGLFTGDFNGDGKLDVLSLDAVPGTAPAAGSASGIASAAVLLSTSATPQAPTVGLTTSLDPATQGTRIQFTATVSGPAGSAPPIGLVTFFDGANSLGTVTLQAGAATLATNTLSVGLHHITAFYQGNATLAPATSAALAERVLVTASPTPLLVPSITQVNLPTAFVAGERGSVAVRITNGGGATAVGRVVVSLYASRDGKLDSSAQPIVSPQTLAVHLRSGRGITFTLRFVAGDFTPGKYTILAQLSAESELTAGQVASAPAASATRFQAAGQVFGTVGGRRNVPLTVTSADGRHALLSLSGPGVGMVTQSASATNLTVTGTTRLSRLRVTGMGAPFTFGAVTVTGPLASYRFKNAVVSGALTIDGVVRALE